MLKNMIKHLLMFFLLVCIATFFIIAGMSITDTPSKKTVYIDCVEWCDKLYSGEPEERFECRQACYFYSWKNN